MDDDIREMALDDIDLIASSKKETKEGKDAKTEPAKTNATGAAGKGQKRGAEEAGLEKDTKSGAPVNKSAKPEGPKKAAPKPKENDTKSTKEDKAKATPSKPAAPKPTETKKPPIVSKESVAVSASEVKIPHAVGTTTSSVATLMETDDKPTAVVTVKKPPVSVHPSTSAGESQGKAAKAATAPVVSSNNNNKKEEKKPAAATPANQKAPAKAVTQGASFGVTGKTANGGVQAGARPAQEGKEVKAAPGAWQDPNEQLAATEQWFLNRLETMACRIEVPEKGARAGKAKIVFYDKTKKADSKESMAILTPLHASYMPECRPYGDWKNPKMAEWRKNQQVPVEAQLKYQLNMKPWHSKLENEQGHDKWCEMFIDEFVPEMERQVVRICVRQAEETPGLAPVLGWIEMYKSQYKPNDQETEEEFLVRRIIEGKPATIRAGKKIPAIVHVKRAVFIPVHPNTNEVLTENRRCTFSVPLCGEVFPKQGETVSPGVACPPHITDPVLRQVYKYRGPNGKRYKLLDQPTIDAAAEELPYEQAVIRHRDVIAMMFVPQATFYEGKLQLKFTVKSKIIYERGKSTSAAEQVKNVISAPLAGFTKLEAPAAAPTYTKDNPSIAEEDSESYDVQGEEQDNSDHSNNSSNSSSNNSSSRNRNNSHELGGEEDLYGEQQQQPVAMETEGPNESQAQMSGAEQEQSLYE